MPRERLESIRATLRCNPSMYQPVLPERRKRLLRLLVSDEAFLPWIHVLQFRETRSSNHSRGVVSVPNSFNCVLRQTRLANAKMLAPNGPKEPVSVQKTCEPQFEYQKEGVTMHSCSAV